jgi:hypothetical protein
MTIYAERDRIFALHPLPTKLIIFAYSISLKTDKLNGLFAIGITALQSGARAEI